jgi:hypothetical protein
MKKMAENKEIKRLGRHYQLFNHKPAEQKGGEGRRSITSPLLLRGLYIG